jgi:hypothetical protein
MVRGEFHALDWRFVPGETMTEPAAHAPSDTRAFRRLVEGTNINEKTLLATDYLNHFNEIVMILDLVPDMPDMLDDAKSWQPVSYEEHFRNSTFKDKDLAIEAYKHVPDETRAVFEGVVGSIDELVARGIARIETTIETAGADALQDTVSDVTRRLQIMLDKASAIINGDTDTLDQTDIDDLLEV